MLLCDIGNSSYHFFDGKSSYKKSLKEFDPKSLFEPIYFISVNAEINAKLKSLENWIDLAVFVQKDRYYETMGVDRIFALEAISHGIIVDAGSAITVDVVRDGVFMGGFITPGVYAMSEAYRAISPALEYEFNFDFDTQRVPKNTQDAISYGFLQPLCSQITAFNLPIYLTGGDAHKFKKVLKNAHVDELLLFKGMQKVMERFIKL